MAKEKVKQLKNINDLSIAAIRSTCIDGINRSNSGHPGMCLSAAPIVYTLYKDFLVSDPTNSDWINRDRFVMSCGHGSMLYYVILHLCGFDVSMKDIKSFRQLKSSTPGHPEVGVTDGVDAGSGPLGQGIAQAVGMAIAETKLQSMYGKNIYNHYTYCLCGDGCLEEGISQEAISFAGLNKLNKLILLYDRNNVTLDGPLAQSSDEDVIERFRACHWNVIFVKKGNSYSQIKKAIKLARKAKKAPTIVIFKTVIGLGSANEGTCKVHGSPLGVEDGKRAKESYGYKYKDFEIPQEVYDNFKNTFAKRGKKAFEAHAKSLDELKAKNEKLYKQLFDFKDNNLEEYFKVESIDQSIFKDDSTRNVSGKVLNFFHEALPNLVGGSADVAGSVKTALKNGSTWGPDNRAGTNINWGIREFFMSAAANGICLHGGLRPYVGTFFVFSDYCKPGIRMSALEKLPTIYLFSHDSIAVGEDGPTHQPIEQLAMLRSIPNLNVFRPCDARETVAAYRIALESKSTPSAIILSRQNLPLLEYSDSYEQVKKGAYVVEYEDFSKQLDFTLIGTGSEVALCVEVKKHLDEAGINARVVSMPCTELFDAQPDKYKLGILGNVYSRRMFVEMASTYGLNKYAKFVFGIDEFGRSGKAQDVIESFKFNPEKISNFIVNLLKGAN